MLFDLFDIKSVKRALKLALLLLIVMFFQNSVFAHIAILGVKPMFVPVVVCGAGMFCGGIWGGVFGLFAGLICDMSFNESVVGFTILFTLTGYGCGLVSELILNRRFFSFLFLSLAALILCAISQMLRFLIVGADILPLLRVAALQTLWSIPFTAPLYFPCRSLYVIK